MTTIGRVVDELRASALANLTIGDAGLLVAAILSDAPGRAVVVFAAVNIVIAVLWARFGPSGKVRRLAPRAGTPPDDAVVEETSVVRRRVWIGLIPVAVMVAILIAIAPESAAVLAGVPAGVGAGDLWVLGWARRYEAERREEILRQVPRSPFSGGQRLVYTRPMNDATDAT